MQAAPVTVTSQSRKGGNTLSRGAYLLNPWTLAESRCSLTLRKAAVIVDDPVAAHKHVGDGRFARWHAVVRPWTEVRHSLSNSHHAKIHHLVCSGFLRQRARCGELRIIVDTRLLENVLS